MEARTCRSGRTGSPPRGETFGYARGLEEGERLRGEMREPHADRREARAHRAPRALAPGHGAPGPRRELLGQGPYAEWPMPPRATNQRRRPAVASILRGWQRCAAGRPDSRLGADAHDVRNGPGRSEEHT